jgi:hypothetical protein
VQISKLRFDDRQLVSCTAPDTVNRFYQLLRLDYISTASQRTKSCPTTFGQTNIPQLLIKPLELDCGAPGMLNFRLWGFNEWPEGGESLQNDCISQTKKPREAKFFGNLMNFGEIIQVFVFEPLNRLISELY